MAEDIENRPKSIHPLSESSGRPIHRVLWDHPATPMPVEEAITRLNNRARLASRGNPDIFSVANSCLSSPDRGPFSINRLFAGTVKIGMTPEEVIASHNSSGKSLPNR